jgi:hypothetical protein
MSNDGIPAGIIGGPDGVPPDLTSDNAFGYAFLSPPQPTFYTLGFNFDTDLGKLNRNTPDVT